MYWFTSFEIKQLSFKGTFVAYVVFGRQQCLMPTAYKPAIIWVLKKKEKGWKAQPLIDSAYYIATVRWLVHARGASALPLAERVTFRPWTRTETEGRSDVIGWLAGKLKAKTSFLWKPARRLMVCFRRDSRGNPACNRPLFSNMTAFRQRTVQ